jgi:hypothetical protein
VPSRLRLIDFSDREFLALCVEAMDAEGWFSSQDVVEKPELGDLEGENPRRHVAVRCSWLWRYGVLEREHLWDEYGNPLFVAGDPERPKWGQRWRMTELGEHYLSGHLTKRQSEALERLGDERMLELTRWLHEHLRGAPDVARTLMLREWRHGTHGVKANANLRGS